VGKGLPRKDQPARVAKGPTSKHQPGKAAKGLPSNSPRKSKAAE